MKKRVLLAMSGGVDSSVTAHLLQQQGFEVVGITLRTFDKGNTFFEKKAAEQYIVDAQILADKLDITHFVIDVREDFKNTIINYFSNKYTIGETPNPCVICNPLIKWKYLYQLSEEYDCQQIATGHYVKIASHNNRYFLTKAVDNTKDQTFFLWNLPQKYLSKTIFPLGNYHKSEIKQIAKTIDCNYLNNKKESFSVCFLGNQNYRDFLENYSPNLLQFQLKGQFVSCKNEILGEHQGFYQYTIGQKVIINNQISYVLNFDILNNSITLGSSENLFSNQFIISEINKMKYENILDCKNIKVVTLYRDSGINCKIEKLDDNYLLTLDTKIRIPAVGQSIAFYQNEDLVGGGFISKILNYLQN